MTRIDANLATQIGDASRPAQSMLVVEDQKNEAQRNLNQSAEPRQLVAAKPDDVKAAAERLQQVIEVATGRSLDFTVNDRFKELVVVISDRRSGETIKEIPSKDLMKLRERINDLIGMFIDEKA